MSIASVLVLLLLGVLLAVSMVFGFMARYGATYSPRFRRGRLRPSRDHMYSAIGLLAFAATIVIFGAVIHERVQTWWLWGTFPGAFGAVQLAYFALWYVEADAHEVRFRTRGIRRRRIRYDEIMRVERRGRRGRRGRVTRITAMDGTVLRIDMAEYSRTAFADAVARGEASSTRLRVG